MKSLFLIPARGGSKGIPGKNIKLLNGKPLIYYSIDIARFFSEDDCICVSTDSDEIIDTVEAYGLNVLFKRPYELATDAAETRDVILHALDWYESNGKVFDSIVLLQPTSPFRLKTHIGEALNLFSENVDMVVSVSTIASNVYSTYFKQTEGEYISRLLQSKSDGERRQDSPKVYKLNGSIYIISVDSIRKKKISEFSRVKKIVMESNYSIDIDEPVDWEWCEFLLAKGLVNFDSKS